MKLKEAVAHVLDDRVYIGFELAKLAAEKGYNGFCNMNWTHYLKTTKYYKKDTYEFDTISGTNDIHKTFISNYYVTYAAPLQSSLQKWLRDEHNLHITIHVHNEGWSYNINNLKGKNGIELLHSSILNSIVTNGYYVNYEKALEEGLLKAI